MLTEEQVMAMRRGIQAFKMQGGEEPLNNSLQEGRAFNLWFEAQQIEYTQTIPLTVQECRQVTVLIDACVNMLTSLHKETVKMFAMLNSQINKLALFYREAVQESVERVGQVIRQELGNKPASDGSSEQ